MDLGSWWFIYIGNLVWGIYRSIHLLNIFKWFNYLSSATYWKKNKNKIILTGLKRWAIITLRKLVRVLISYVDVHECMLVICYFTVICVLTICVPLRRKLNLCVCTVVWPFWQCFCFVSFYLYFVVVRCRVSIFQFLYVHEHS